MPVLNLIDEDMVTLRQVFEAHHGTEENIRDLQARLFEPECKTLMELGEKYFEDADRLNRMCYAKDGTIYLNDGQYEITLDRVKTPEAILAWVIHLLPKSWVDYEVLRKFIYLASEQAGIPGEKLTQI